MIQNQTAWQVLFYQTASERPLVVEELGDLPTKAITAAPRRSSRRNDWILKKVESRGRNKAIVALANKNARIIWALLSRKEEYVAA